MAPVRLCADVVVFLIEYRPPALISMMTKDKDTAGLHAASGAR